MCDARRGEPSPHSVTTLEPQSAEDASPTRAPSRVEVLVFVCKVPLASLALNRSPRLRSSDAWLLPFLPERLGTMARWDLMNNGGINAQSWCLGGLDSSWCAGSRWQQLF